MKALVWHGTNDVRVERVPDPKILNPRDAIIRVTATAICGSDVHLLDGYMPTMKAGDILVQFGDKPIKNLYDFTDALRRSKIGDVVEVKVLRDGQPVTASVKLEQRK